MSIFYDKFIRRMLFSLPAEAAHEFGINALRRGMVPVVRQQPDFGPLKRFGLNFSGPLGMAAGFDKNAVVVNRLASLGVGFVEVGTVTFEPQPGNPRPRIFRLPKDEALINRLGFNNEGAEVIGERLREISPACVVGVNIGKNKNVSTEDAAENYLKCFELIHAPAHYVAVNVSSPNTPNLRDLQQERELDELLSVIQMRNGQLGKKPLLVKIAPDLTEAELEMVVDVCIRNDIAGIVATNTTISRSALKTPQIEIAKIGAGGLSGRPIAQRSTEVVSAVYRQSKGKMTVVGVGGIFTPDDAFEKIAAGASLIQAYTGFIYHGPMFADHINHGIAKILRQRGFSSLDEAVGSAHV